MRRCSCILCTWEFRCIDSECFSESLNDSQSMSCYLLSFWSRPLHAVALLSACIDMMEREKTWVLMSRHRDRRPYLIIVVMYFFLEKTRTQCLSEGVLSGSKAIQETVVLDEPAVTIYPKGLSAISDNWHPLKYGRTQKWKSPKKACSACWILGYHLFDSCSCIRGSAESDSSKFVISSDDVKSDIKKESPPTAWSKDEPTTEAPIQRASLAFLFLAFESFRWSWIACNQAVRVS